MFSKLATLLLTIGVGVFILPFSAPVAHKTSSSFAASKNQAQQVIRCDRIIVKDYPLSELVRGIFVACGKEDFLTYAEDIPLDKATETIQGVANSPASFEELLRTLGGNHNLAFQKLQYPAGKFDAEQGYLSEGVLTTEKWVVCLTPQVKDKPQLIAKGKVRIYSDASDNKYHLVANMASAKLILHQIYQLYGKPGQVRTFIAETVKDLTRLGVSLDKDKVDVKVTLDLSSSQFNDSVRQQLVQAIYKDFVREQGLPSAEQGFEIWPLTFGISKGGGEESQSLVELLNKVFGDNSLTLSRQNLFLHGTPEKRLQIKRLLAKIDNPWPQVQMNMWTIQVSGKPDKIAPQLLAIKNDTSRTQAAIIEAQQVLNDLLAADQNKFGSAEWDRAKALSEKKRKALLTRDESVQLQKLQQDCPALILLEIGFERRANDALSLNEALIFWGAHPDPDDIYRRFKERVGQIEARLTAATAKDYEVLRQTFPSLTNPTSGVLTKNNDLSRLKTHFRNEAKPQVQNAIKDFVAALAKFRMDVDDPEAPTKLQRESVVIDRLLKNGMDAFALDMQEVFFAPLLRRIQQLNGGISRRRNWSDEGITLTGQARLVVTSRSTSELEPKMKYYANVTRPKPLGQELLNKAFPNNQDGKAAPRVPLFDLETLPALLLAAGLLEEKPVYAEISPGVQISVQPTVLPDGAAARLSLDCNFGVTSTIPTGGSEVWGQAHADGIQSHHIKTDAVISVFDLFDISSFSIESTHPQAPYYIPVLGRLPIVGPAFQFPRDKKRVHHESIMLINAVILPRSLDLARYYSEY